MTTMLRPFRVPLQALLTLTILCTVLTAPRLMAEPSPQERMKDMEEAYLKEPNSEGAHVRSLLILITQKKYKKAHVVVESFLKLNPESKQAALYKKQLQELEALNGKTIPADMNTRHIKEMRKAVMADSLAGQSAEEKAFITSMQNDQDQDNIMKGAQALNDSRKERMHERFPELCEYQKKVTTRSKEYWDVRIKMNTVEVEEGRQGLRQKYPDVLQANPEMLGLHQDYIDFLIRDKQLDAAKAFASKSLKTFPENPKFTLVQERLQDLENVRSKERKQQFISSLQTDLLSLMLATTDCLTKGLNVKGK